MSDKEIIRIGIIGAGFARTTQIPAFKACAGARITAITSAHRERAAEVAREFGIEHVTTDWRELVARDGVDLVSIVTPVVTHGEMTLAALGQGKAVLCEKPMAMNAAEALRMTERAREAEVLALIDHELRFLPGRIEMREMLRRGELGRVRHAKLTFRSDARADPERPWNWWSDEAQGGGALGAIGSHIIDAFRWLLDSEVSQVFCNLATHISERVERDGSQPRPVTSDDEANLILRFADSDLTLGTTGTASMSMVEPGKSEHRLEIFGSSGALMIEEGGDLWHSNVGDGEWKRIETGRGELAPGMREGGWSRGFTVFSREIVKALGEGRTTVAGAATFEDGYRTQLVLDAAHRSHESGCWAEIDQPQMNTD
ncbi:MAG: Gfo/Idh/MocA family oxidoreductase [Pyrinomonadaceae bacterium]